MIYTVSDGTLSLSVNTAGGSMTSIKYNGEERQWQGGEAWKGQDVVIFPIVGHASEYTVGGKSYAPKSHGVARYAEFSLKEKGENFITLSLSSDEVTRLTYPYDFTLEISYRVEGGEISVRYYVRSHGGKIPFYIGGHPGLKAEGGEAEIEFENEEHCLIYPLGADAAVPVKLKRFIANKAFFKECKTFQLGSLSGGKIYARTRDGYVYTYRSNCPVFAFWSNEDGGDYICVEPWWGINDFPAAPRELSLKPFINFADEKGRTFGYTLSVSKQ